ncbi:hypothetical protein FA95DRAFT_1682944 [Auriscalpium vulgare]|uniref:Uncharacterized protein n=1 Tax=Auriscalpium vulgare TaxID=40419 RepID=A0ACB8RCU0_9AGAM|nr:hypothetical protein FA95DRAFT_1682944 [Auriscalpium vulgare]
MSSSPHSRRLAVMTMSAIALAVGGMYAVGRQTKAEEQPKPAYGNSSPNSKDPAQANSSTVRETMHKPVSGSGGMLKP